MAIGYPYAPEAAVRFQVQRGMRGVILKKRELLIRGALNLLGQPPVTVPKVTRGA